MDEIDQALTYLARAVDILDKNQTILHKRINLLESMQEDITRSLLDHEAQLAKIYKDVL